MTAPKDTAAARAESVGASLRRITHMMRRTDYMSAVRHGHPVWIGAFRCRRKPLDGQHKILTNRRTGETVYATFGSSTPTHWRVYLCREGKPSAVTKLSRAVWRLTWHVVSISMDDSTHHSARAIGDYALAEAILDARAEDRPEPPLPAGVEVPSIYKVRRPAPSSVATIHSKAQGDRQREARRAMISGGDQ
jgi:hypothetical protein